MKPYWNHCWSTIVAQTLFFKQCLKRSEEIYFRNSTLSWTVLSSQTLPRRSGTTALSSLSAPRQDRQDMKMWRDTGFKPSKKNGRDKRFQKSIDENSEKMKIRTRGTWKIMETCLNPCFSNLFFDSNHVSTCICIFHIAVSGFILCKKKNLYIGKLIHDRKCMCILEY